MNSDYRRNRESRRAAPLAVMTAVAVLATATACSGSAASSGSNSGGNQQAVSDLKLAQCMRAHGATNFPDPVVAGQGVIFQGNFYFSSPQWQQAESACKSLAPAGFFPSAS